MSSVSSLEVASRGGPVVVSCLRTDGGSECTRTSGAAEEHTNISADLISNLGIR